jgi:hypothetical protein
MMKPDEANQAAKTKGHKGKPTEAESSAGRDYDEGSRACVELVKLQRGWCTGPQGVHRVRGRDSAGRQL